MLYWGSKSRGGDSRCLLDDGTGERLWDGRSSEDSDSLSVGLSSQLPCWDGMTRFTHGTKATKRNMRTTRIKNGVGSCGSVTSYQFMQSNVTANVAAGPE
jgi:hypothetical protein